MIFADGIVVLGLYSSRVSYFQAAGSANSAAPDAMVKFLGGADDGTFHADIGGAQAAAWSCLPICRGGLDEGVPICRDGRPPPAAMTPPPVPPQTTTSKDFSSARQDRPPRQTSQRR